MGSGGKDSYTLDTMRKQLAEDFSFMSYAPILFISAATGQRIDKLFETIRYVDQQNSTRIPTRRAERDAGTRHCPGSAAFGQGQAAEDLLYHPKFHPSAHVCLLCHQKALFHFSYKRYLENQIRETFGMTGTPIRMLVREHGDGTARA